MRDFVSLSNRLLVPIPVSIYIFVKQIDAFTRPNHVEKLRAVRSHVDEIIFLNLLTLTPQIVDALPLHHIESMFWMVNFDLVKIDARIEREDVHRHIKCGILDWA